MNKCKISTVKEIGRIERYVKGKLNRCKISTVDEKRIER